MAADHIVYCLSVVTDYAAFERLCCDIMALEGYRLIEVLGGTNDKGRDALHVDVTTRIRSIFSYSVRKDWRTKLAEDCEKIVKHRHACDRFVFVCASTISPTERDTAIEFIRDTYGWELDLYGIERLASMLRSTHRILVQQHPSVFNPSFFQHGDLPGVILTPFASSRLPLTGELLIGRSEELRVLTGAWYAPTTNVVQIVAPGGIGKTQLIKTWADDLLNSSGSGGAVRAYSWSFYLHGAEKFLRDTLCWFGEPEQALMLDTWAIGTLLARRFKEARTLLLLDGLEVLQQSHGPKKGRLKVQALQAFLRGMSNGNPGLCVVTTREAVPDLKECGQPQCITINLTSLRPSDGAALLQRLGVHGKQSELEQAAVEVEGHSLALILLGTLLRDRCGGDVRRRRNATLLRGEERYSAHARKVMAAYERWFVESHDEISGVALTIMRIIGLFDGPVSEDWCEALRAEPPISGLTDKLFVDDRDEVWARALQRLKDACLLWRSPHDGSIGCHPLVREYFAEQNRLTNVEATRRAHDRMYRYFLKCVPAHLATAADIQPLCDAVMHAYKAGLHNEAYTLFRTRVLSAPRRFASHQLGAFGGVLDCLRIFFDGDIGRMACAASLESDQRSYLINEIGFHLQAVGLVSESLRFKKEAIRLNMLHNTLESLQDVARASANLSEAELYCMKLADALRSGCAAVRIAKENYVLPAKDFALSTFAYTLSKLGQVLHHLGLLEEALKCFRRAEEDYRNIHSVSTFLPEAAGMLYCEVLLDMGQFEDVSIRADEIEKVVAVEIGRRIDSAFASLIHGKLLLQLAKSRVYPNKDEKNAEGLLKRALAHLSASVDVFVETGVQDDLPRALIPRAETLRMLGRIEEALADLELAGDIADFGGMTMWQVDISIEKVALASSDSFNAKSLMRELCEMRRRASQRVQIAPDDWEHIGFLNGSEPKRVEYCRRDLDILALAKAKGITTS